MSYYYFTEKEAFFFSQKSGKPCYKHLNNRDAACHLFQMIKQI